MGGVSDFQVPLESTFLTNGFQQLYDCTGPHLEQNRSRKATDDTELNLFMRGQKLYLSSIRCRSIVRQRPRQRFQ